MKHFINVFLPVRWDLKGLFQVSPWRCLSDAKRDKFRQISVCYRSKQGQCTQFVTSKSISHLWLFSNSLLPAFTATAGPAAERKVRDPEEPGALLLHLCRCDGIQGRNTHTHTKTHRIMKCPLRWTCQPSWQQDHVCELLNTIDACQVFFDIVSPSLDSALKPQPKLYSAVAHRIMMSTFIPVRRWTLTSPRTTWTWWWRTRPWWPSCPASRRGRPSSACTTTPTRWRTEPGEPRVRRLAAWCDCCRTGPWCCLCCSAATGNIPDWARWLWIMRTLWRRWWRSLFLMGR